jgi:hypothetical protein
LRPWIQYPLLRERERERGREKEREREREGERESYYKEEEIQALWLKPIILATWEADIGRILWLKVGWGFVHKTPSQSIAGYSGMCLSFQLQREA